MNNAIPYSCDTFFYMLGDKLGIDRIVKYATAFGYGQKTGIDLPGEQAGLMPSAQWKAKNYHARWYPDETLDVAIGQGAVEATPLQLARIIGGIASGGHLVRPHVVFPDQLPAEFRKSLVDSFPGSGDAYVPIDPANWEIITDGMYNVTQPGLYHTAGAEGLPGIDFAGKTGTRSRYEPRGAGEDQQGQDHVSQRMVRGRDAAPQSRACGGGVVAERRVQLVPGAHRRCRVVEAFVDKKRRLAGNLPQQKAAAPVESGCGVDNSGCASGREEHGGCNDQGPDSQRTFFHRERADSGCEPRRCANQPFASEKCRASADGEGAIQEPTEVAAALPERRPTLKSLLKKPESGGGIQ